jgi:hypothetical protein
MHGESPGPVRTPDFAVHTIVIPPATPTVHPPPAHASHKRKRETSHEIPGVEPDADETAPEWFFKLHGSINGRSLSGLPAIDPNQLGTLVCYVCISDPVPGKFRARDAAALGVPKGPLLGQLAKNLSVTLADGRVITPEQVKDPDTPGKIVVIVPCPSLGDIERVTTHATWSGLLADPCPLGDVSCVVHLGLRSVVCHPDYYAWSSRFPPSTTHIYVRMCHCVVCFLKVLL